MNLVTTLIESAGLRWTHGPGRKKSYPYYSESILLILGRGGTVHRTTEYYAGGRPGGYHLKHA